MGLYNQPFLGANQWQAQVAFQYADTNDFFVGDQRVENPLPNGPALYGTPPHRKVSIYDLDVFYGISNRLSLDMTLPFLVGSGESSRALRTATSSIRTPHPGSATCRSRRSTG